jgi:hypothetical protein
MYINGKKKEPVGSYLIHFIDTAAHEDMTASPLRSTTSQNCLQMKGEAFTA